tara:strand:- start:78 stop:686 length:609 start_codon:yes stop_codon:yes gene_type:complete
MERKKKIRLAQIIFLFLGLFTIFFTYLKRETNQKETLISVETKKKIEKQLSDQKSLNDNDTFYNVEYSGFDLNGNRYIIKCKEAVVNKNSIELIKMQFVNAKFYFKDDTTLFINSDSGIYNNKTLDIQFSKNVKGSYLNSKLFAQNANYSNSNGYVSISNNVIIEDPKGSVFAKKLLFDIKTKTLKISSSQNERVKANITLK